MKFKEYQLNNQTYKVSTTIVWCFVVFGLILGITGLSYNPTGSAKYYSSCNIPDCASSNLHACDCKNFFYNNSNYCGKDIPFEDSLCTEEWVLNGEIVGTPPPFIIANMNVLLVAGLVLSIVINHLLYNKDFKFGGDA